MGKSMARRTLEALATLEDGVWGFMRPLITSHKLSRGSVYAVLVRLETTGFVRSQRGPRCAPP